MGMAATGIEQRTPPLPAVLSVIDYGLDLATLAQTDLLKLDRV